MRKIKSNLCMLAGAVLGVSVAASLATSAIAADITLKLAGVVPVEHFGNEVLEGIKTDIEAANVGLSVKLFPAGQLGSGEELLEDTIRGNVDIVHAFVYAHKDPILEINSLPFLVSSWDEMEKVYGSKDSEYSKIMTEVLDRMGLVFLANVVEGPIGVVSTKKPDNYATTGPKNMNIRVWSSNVAKSATESIGFNTTTMNWAEVFAAVQAGTVDGAICCTAQLTYTNFAQSDVGKYFIPYNAFVEASTYYASKKTWAKLDDAQRQAVQAAVDKAAVNFTKFARENDDSYITKLRESGWEVLDLTDEERGALAAHIKTEVWPQVEEIVGKDIIDRLRNDK
jgi:TRAP-type C4-dicarboxylate transport system substrate-binding protein